MKNERQCEICGMIEPPFWFEQPMNEEIKEYARNYVSPVKYFYPSLTDALAAWGYYDD